MDRTESPFDFQPGEIEVAQSGDDLRCTALDHDLPRDGDAERDLRRALPPARNPQTPWIANCDHSLSGLHVWQRPLEASLVKLGHSIVCAQGQARDPGGDNEPSCSQAS